MSMDNYGQLWTSMDMYGHLWTPMDMYGHVWTSIDIGDILVKTWKKLPNFEDGVVLMCIFAG